MADASLLPPGIRDERFLALLALLDRWDEIDLLALLPNRVDSAPESLLYPLAWQLGVTGLAGWDLATTDETRRDLLRRAIEIHRRKGTPWAIREAFRAVGFPEIQIEEGYGKPAYGGTRLFDGQAYYSPMGAWGDFGVTVGRRADGTRIGPATRALLRGIIETWKPARSRLVDQRYEEYRFDGAYRYDGEATYAGSLSPAATP